MNERLRLRSALTGELGFLEGKKKTACPKIQEAFKLRELQSYQQIRQQIM